MNTRSASWGGFSFQEDSSLEEVEMTTMQHATRATLEERIKAYLVAATSAHRPMLAIREEVSSQFTFPGLTIWGPEIWHEDSLVVPIIERIDGKIKQTTVSIHAPAWCDWERGVKKRPLAS